MPTVGEESIIINNSTILYVPGFAFLNVNALGKVLH
jgi:hypothetical protein